MHWLNNTNYGSFADYSGKPYLPENVKTSVSQVSVLLGCHSTNILLLKVSPTLIKYQR